MSTFRLSLALLGLTSFAAPAIAHAEKACVIAKGPQRGLAVDKASHPAPQLPPFKKPGARIETFVTNTQVTYSNPVRVDPIQGEVSGVPLGGHVSVKALGEPKAISLPEGEVRRAAGPAWERKQVNKTYNREVRKQIAMAQNKTEIFKIEPSRISTSADTNASVPFSGKTVKLENEPVTVASRTPLDVTVTDKFGRQKTLRTEAVGAERVTTSQTVWNGRQNVTTSTDKGGQLAGTMKPVVQTANLRVSRPFVNAEGETMVKVLSLGAFAGNNATVKVINRETGKEVSMQKISRAGGGAIAIPAYRKADLRLVVEYPAVDKRSDASKTVYDFQAPDFASAKSGRHAAFENVSFTKVE